MKTTYQKKLLFPEILWERPVHQYKSEAGKVLVIAGSRGSQGIALLTCEAIFRCGTGILTLAFPEELTNTYTGILPEAMTLALPQTHSGSLARAAGDEIIEQVGATDLILVGPGLSTNTETVQLIWEILPRIEKPLIIDGDGLKALAYGIDAIRSKEGIDKVHQYFNDLDSQIIITPHPGETSHILSALGEEKFLCKASYIEKHKEESAARIASQLKVSVVIKGQDTVIVSDKSAVVDLTNDSKIALDIVDDVLAGVIASFVAQNPTKRFQATCTAVYLYSLANQLAKVEVGEGPIKANDTIRFLPQAIKKAENH